MGPQDIGSRLLVVGCFWVVAKKAQEFEGYSFSCFC